MATGPPEAQENDGGLCGSSESVEHGGAAVKEHWYHSVDGDIRYPFEAGEEEADTAERRRRPACSKRETRYTGSSDWRGVPIVSLPFNTVLIQ